MGITLITLPASHGKTTWVVNQVKQENLGLTVQPRVVLPSQQQVVDFESRLARAGGSLGVKVGTMLDLASDVLDLGNVSPLLLTENVQIKVLRAVVDDLDLAYYQPIQTKPGFIRSCLGIIRELKAGQINPEDFLDAAAASGTGPRLIELGLIYAAYQDLLRKQGWSDRAGLIWIALRCLEENSHVGQSWGNIYVDGFDDLTPVQLQLINLLADRAAGVYLTLTGTIGGDRRELVHKRFLRVRELLEAGQVNELNVQASGGENPAGPGALLEPLLFNNINQPLGKVVGEIKLAAVPDREAEVRTALRWIRTKILEDAVNPNEAAILVRNLEPYRGLLSRIASEYSIPVRIQGGLPLAENPLIAEILKLLKLISQGREGLIWHEVLSLWRSPYLNWQILTDHLEMDSSLAKHLAETKQLEAAARWGRVIQGYSQWEETFRFLIDEQAEGSGEHQDQAILAFGLPVGQQAAQIWDKFIRFVDLITPPTKEASREKLIIWFEGLLGGMDPEQPLTGGLGVAGQVFTGSGEVVGRDWEALAALNRIFREILEAERLLKSPPVDFQTFLTEVEEIINQTSFQPKVGQDNAVLCAGCTEARGLIFQAVAVLGLAEGEFPGTIKEDPFIRDEERAVLQDQFNIPLRLSVDSAEGEYFYESVTRSTHSLLLTRPRIADNGAVWQPSPYWEEILRITDIVPEILTTRTRVVPELAASQAELLGILAARGITPATGDCKLQGYLLEQLRRIEKAKDVLHARNYLGEIGSSVHDGDLRQKRESMLEQYPADHVWSASRLETYQTCPFQYLISYLLGLEKPEPPEEGLNSLQLGNIYHRILEDLYLEAGESYTIASLLEALPDAAEGVFWDAPKREGFRETPYWEQTQQEILGNLKLALIRLEGVDPEFKFYAAEQRFGMYPVQDKPVAIEVKDQGKYLLRGLIDRVDLNQHGEVRLVDYKTSGRSGFDNKAVSEGKKLQLPLYAIAAQEGLNLGIVKEGFYFHLLAAEPSYFKMSSYRGQQSKRGPEAAMERAAAIGLQTVDAIREGRFSPIPPDGGCPDYCPAAGFCWHYRPRRW